MDEGTEDAPAHTHAESQECGRTASQGADKCSKEAAGGDCRSPEGATYLPAAPAPAEQVGCSAGDAAAATEARATLRAAMGLTSSPISKQYDIKQQAAPAPPAAPARWGDASFYEYQPNYDMFLCRLCGKYVTDGHIQARKHQDRMSRAWDYLDEYNRPDSTSACGPSPPPPDNPVATKATETELSQRILKIYGSPSEATAAPPMPSGPPREPEEQGAAAEGAGSSQGDAVQEISTGSEALPVATKATEAELRQRLQRCLGSSFKAPEEYSDTAKESVAMENKTITDLQTSTASTDEAATRRHQIAWEKHDFFHCRTTGQSLWVLPTGVPFREEF